ncbi:MAG: pyridoxal-phosphate dependent enzyme, partial [Actinobacteria bacterium]|nr:pyridoxal-phosphate dependent enzyme [Actinomycetota bacterium]
MRFSYPGIIERYREFLPVNNNTPIVSLNEGSTPLIKSVSLSEKYGCELYYKFEGLNPTGSFKDRGMTLAISKAKEEGSQAVMCA